MRIYDILAQTLAGAKDGVSDPQPRLSELLEALGPRSFGITLVLFGLPNLLPIPGLPMLCGIVVGAVAIQILRGDESLLLPGWLGNWRLKREDLSQVVRRARPTLEALEKVMRPRLLDLTSPLSQRAIGGALLLLAISLMAPIPFFGGIPPGIAVILFGLALIERDGVFVVLGVLASVFALLFTGILTFALVRGLFGLIF